MVSEQRLKSSWKLQHPIHDVKLYTCTQSSSADACDAKMSVLAQLDMLKHLSHTTISQTMCRICQQCIDAIVYGVGSLMFVCS